MLRHTAGMLLACALLSLAACDGGSIFADNPSPIGSGGAGTIRGQVRTAAGGVGGVRVVLVNRDSALTDGAGVATFNNLPAATYTLQIRVPAGFTLFAGDSVQRSVQVPSSGNAVTVLYTLQQTATTGGGTF